MEEKGNLPGFSHAGSDELTAATMNVLDDGFDGLFVVVGDGYVKNGAALFFENPAH